MLRFNPVQILCWMFVACLTLVYAHDCKAQFTDDFSDGDFTNNPAWSGTDTKFSIQSNQLRLTDGSPAANNTAYLSVSSQAIDDAVWEFSVRLDFDPSASNYADVYLTSNNAILTASLNGYFVRIGHTATDNISLFRQTGTTKTAILTGTIASITTPSTPVSVRVTRNQSGEWNLFTDVGNTGTFQMEGGVTDATHVSSSYFGVLCTYTTTRNQHFFFDDFVVTGDPYIDPSQPANYKDIIVNEIFADPSPVIGLPEAEFVELYNRSEKIINLAGWKFTDGSSTAVLSGFMQPGEYRIVTPATSATLFNAYGSVLGVTNFPSLNNSGDNLELRRSDDVLIDKVSYSDSWYRDDDKKQGGYTLELIDPTNPCGEEDNWIASEAAAGGTPGAPNSVWASKPDLTGPKLIAAIPVSENSLLVKFNEKLEAETPALNTFSIIPEISISSIVFSDASLRTLLLTVSTTFQSRTLYSLTAQNIFDCNGNKIEPEFATASFALPEPAEEKDLIINEILFNPRPTGVDFVEVYNNSDKYISFKNWAIANYVNDQILNAKIISQEDVLIVPHTHMVFTENKDVIKGQYIQAHEDRIFEVNDLPSFNDSEGTVALINPNNVLIDYFSYKDDYHLVFLKNDEGVSLERVSATAPTNDPANWQSASSTVGYATPGYRNSNARGESLADKVKVDPEIFEPISGQPSFTQIHYNFETGGYVANVKILDAQGREVKQLVNNSTLGTTGFFRWDGDTHDGSKARTGYYIVWIEVFNANGTVEAFRKRVIVASRF